MMKLLICGMSLSAMGLHVIPSPSLKKDNAVEEGQYDDAGNAVEEGEAVEEMDFRNAGHGQQHLTAQAVTEAGMNQNQLSEFGKNSFKFPKSMVDEILKAGEATERTHRYNFAGRTHGQTKQETKARKWAIDFAKETFSEEKGDIFFVTGSNASWAYSQRKGYSPLGPWDKTSTLGSRDMHVHNKTSNPNVRFDATYWDLLLSSEFTLCPGGDDHFSHRAYEAALAGSICVIKSRQADWRPSIPNKVASYVNLERVFNQLKYVTLDEPHVYDKAMADHNREVFIKYMTFIEGDNTPPKVKGLKRQETSNAEEE
eukprot:gnl/MRDRNA2_/MRDRNA2_61914_c0_seq1.p1 gnl/MRDRNA2_/MRDRNA2_61914_c0~~gnl/MRDRNA2_/MRDRNA2_61914_c0_seq1.p1  ORF type:complete len:313 (-),score=63.55 gnl/MRDRNA2_/MRDRNA2_61914_c0_seq1:98-1036(-)